MHVEMYIGGYDQRTEPLVQAAYRQDRLIGSHVLLMDFAERRNALGAGWNTVAHQGPAFTPYYPLHGALHAFRRDECEDDNDGREHQPPAFGDGAQAILQ